MGLLDRVVRALAPGLDDKQTHEEVSLTDWSDLQGELARTRAALETEKRIRWEYFAVIESIEKQRDGWREAFHEQSRGHLAAQVKLEEWLSVAQQICAKLLVEVNAHRKERGLEPRQPKAILAEMRGTSDVYRKAMSEVEAKQPPAIDGKAARAVIDERVA